MTGILTVFFDVADQSYLPSLLEADQLVEGNSKLQVSVSAAQIGGQGVGGAIIGLVTAPFAVLADAMSFLGSAVLVFLIRKPEPPPSAHGRSRRQRGPGMRTEIAEGLRYVLGNRYLRNIAASTGTSNLFSSLMFSIFFVYVFRNLELSPLTIGLVGGLGEHRASCVGALIAGRFATRIGVGRAIVWRRASAGRWRSSSRSRPSRRRPSRSSSCPCSSVSSMVVIYNVNQVSLRQAITPERMQGRMNATMRFIVWGTMPIGIDRRRDPRLDDRPARDALGRRDRRLLRVRAGAPVAGPLAARDPDRAGPARVQPRAAAPRLGLVGSRQPRSSSIGTRTPRSRATSSARS